MIDEIINTIESSDCIDFRTSFNNAKTCSKMISSVNDEDQVSARKIIIHILNCWDKLTESSRCIWIDLVEAAGFYPYLSKINDNMNSNLDYNIRLNFHASEYLPNKFFHLEQKKIAALLSDGKNVIISAPTSFGKSLLIDEIVASNKYNNIVVIQPTLALLDETRLRLKKYDKRYKLIVRTSQEPSEEKGNLFLLTAERVTEYKNLPKIDLLVIDEFYKLSLKREDERANILNNAFQKILKQGDCNFYLLGPNIDNISEGFKEKYNAIFYETNFSLVDCNSINLFEKVDFCKSGNKIDEQKRDILFNLLVKLKNEQSIVYCSSPARARKLAYLYCKYLQYNTQLVYGDLPLIEWIEQNVSKEWNLIDCLKSKIGFHDGSLQKHISTSIIKYFNEDSLNVIFCTSTIIEGVNTSAKNVIYFDNQKGGKQIDYFDYSNIKGRAGRMMTHFVGNIYNLNPPPEKTKCIIDFPFYDQEDDPFPTEILININRSNIKDKHLARFDDFMKKDPELIDIIRYNGQSVEGQFTIYDKLLIEMKINNTDFCWTTEPTYSQLLYLLTLANECMFSLKGRSDIFSIKQLTALIFTYKVNRSLFPLIEDNYQWSLNKLKRAPDDNKKREKYNKAIEEIFHIYKHWFQFVVPKTLRTLDSLQRYVAKKLNVGHGSYSYFINLLENDFIRANLSILSEYGVPNSATEKLEKLIPDSLNEEDVINYIKSKNFIYKMFFRHMKKIK